MSPNYDAILSADQDTRAGLFTATAQRLGTTPQECREGLLGLLDARCAFQRTSRRPEAAVKGGTSLSKGFGLIRRFSEDNIKIVQQKNLMAAHEKVNLATTPKGGSLTRSLRLARSGEQPRVVGYIDQSNVA